MDQTRMKSISRSLKTNAEEHRTCSATPSNVTECPFLKHVDACRLILRNLQGCVHLVFSRHLKTLLFF